MLVAMLLFCQFLLNRQIVIITSPLILLTRLICHPLLEIVVIMSFLMLTRFICTPLLELVLTSSKYGLLQTEVKAELKQWIWNFWDISTHYSHRTEAFNIYAINNVRWHRIGSLRTLVPPTPFPESITLLVALCLFSCTEDGTSKFFLDSGNYPPDYTASQPRRL
jgi:hypothetical protein